MIHAVLVAYENPDQTLTRYERDLRPALEIACTTFGLGPAITVIDNSAIRSDSLNARFGADYTWNGGRNLQYGPSINAAVLRRPASFILYCCSRHGRAFDPTWAADLIAPMIADPVVGLTGCLWGSNSPEGVAHDTGQPWVGEWFRFVNEHGDGYVPKHVQGGVFAGRAEVFLRFPYPESIPHLYTDHWITWAALKAGYTCVDVPSVRSIWRDRWLNKYRMDGVKYLHDDENV